MNIEDLEAAYVDLAMSMVCVRVALDYGWSHKARNFASSALHKVDVVNKKLRASHEIPCNEVTRRMLNLK
jgi:hypothetical protein